MLPLDGFLKKVKDMKEQHSKNGAREYKFEVNIPHIKFEGIKDSLDTGPVNDVNALNHFLQMKYKESNYEIEKAESILWVFIYIHDDTKLYDILEELAERNKTVSTDVRIVRRLN